MKKLVEKEDIPYTIIAHTKLLEKFSIFLKGSSIKAILREMREGEDLRITVCNGGDHEFEVVDTYNKYGDD